MPRYSNYGSLDNRLVDEGDFSFSRINARLRPDQLSPSEVAMSSNGRMDINGTWQTRKGHQHFGSSLVTDELALSLPFYVYGNVTSTGLSRAGDVITITFGSPHSFQSSTLANVSGITGITPDPNGNREITVVSPTSISIEIVGLSGTIGGTATVGAPKLNDNVINAAYGSCLYSDPSGINKEYIAVAANSKVFLVDLSNGNTTEIEYPSGVSISSKINMLQAFNYIFIFREGQTALQWDGDLTGSLQFTLVENGDYTQPLVYSTAANTDIADGVVTITETGHDVSVNDLVKIINRGDTNLNELSEYRVFEADSTTFKFYADADDIAGASVVLSKPMSVGGGFCHMPAPPWAIYHQRRLWMPFLYTTSGTPGSPTITSRGIADEIIASDILDQNTYDQIYGNYRIASGGADRVVAIQPFAEDNLVVFNRNTIHLIRGVSGALEETVVQEITREVGCLARKSVVQVGNQIFFLSDNGVYAVAFEDLYNLRGASIPLSESIDPIIKRINRNHAHKAVAIYHDNRYYLSVALDSSTVNNTILVYNFLNNGWESVDTTQASGWDIENLIRAGAGSLNKLYAVNSFGGIHILEEREDDNDVVTAEAGALASTYKISSYVTTRQYTGGTMDRKKYNSFEIQAQSSETNNSDIDITFEAENPDSITAMDSFSTLLGETLAVGEDASVRGRIGNIRGYGGQFTLTPRIGRPKIRSLKVSSQLTDLSISSNK